MILNLKGMLLYNDISKTPSAMEFDVDIAGIQGDLCRKTVSHTIMEIVFYKLVDRLVVRCCGNTNKCVSSSEDEIEVENEKLQRLNCSRVNRLFKRMISCNE